jgi:uncharacterized protein
MEVILDTGPLVAYLIEADEHHKWAVDAFASVPPRFWTCEPVLTEAIYLVRSNRAAVRFIGRMLDNDWLRLPFAFNSERKRVLDLMDQYSLLPMSLADACLVRMAEVIEDAAVMTLDRHFRIYRKNHRQLIKTIMPPGDQRR